MSVTVQLPGELAGELAPWLAAGQRRRLSFARIGASGSAGGAAQADGLLAQGYRRD